METHTQDLLTAAENYINTSNSPARPRTSIGEAFNRLCAAAKAARSATEDSAARPLKARRNCQEVDKAKEIKKIAELYHDEEIATAQIYDEKLSDGSYVYGVVLWLAQSDDGRLGSVVIDSESEEDANTLWAAITTRTGIEKELTYNNRG